MPYVERPYLVDPADVPVWRYMNLEKLLSILIDQALFFASVKTLAQSDRYEGQPTPAEITASGLMPSVAKELDQYNASTKGSLFFSCWHMNDSESDAMWKLYVAGTGGVAVRSSIARIKRCFQKTQEDISLGKIAYIDEYYSSIEFFNYIVQRFMRKRLAFRHEKEIRLVYYDENQSRLGFPGVLIPVEVNVLIEKIVISPRADDWFLSLVKTLVARLGYNIDVVPSEGSRPLPI
jgi:hypothetical protein